MDKPKTATELLVELAVNYAKYGTCYPSEQDKKESNKNESKAA